MSCEKTIALVEKLADGEASAVEKRDAESHLESCARCRAHFEFLASLTEAAGSSALPQPPDSYWEHLPRKILHRIEEDRARSRFSALWRRLLAPDALRWGVLGATLVLLVAVGASVFRDDLGLVVEEAPPAIAPAPAPQAAPAPRGLPSEPEPAAPRQRPTATRAAEDVVAPSPPPPMARDEGAKTPASPGLESEAEDRIAGDAEAPRRALGYVAERPAESVAPAPASPTFGGALSVESTADRDRSFSASTEAEENAFRLLKQREPAAEGRRARAEDALVSPRAGSEVDCEGWRRFLSTYGDEGPRAIDARYELARCSLLRFERNPSTELRDEAVADAEAFLAREAEGPRAEEIRKALGRARRSP